MSTSTGGNTLPSSFVTSPKCVMSGKCRLVMEIGAASISLAHRGTIPLRRAARGKTPMPSNKLPKVIALLVVLPPLSMCAEDTLCDAAGFEQHKAEQHRVAHRAPYGPDGVPAGGNPLDKHGIDCHAHQNEQPLESHGE